MRKFFLISVFCFCSLLAQCLEISIDAGSFKNEGKSYLEMYIRILGETADFQPSDLDKNKFQAGVELTLIISQLDQIVTFEKYTLNSPLVDGPNDFLDVKRFALKEGEYQVKIEAYDLNDKENKLELERDVTVLAYNENVNLSDVQLFGSVQASEPSNPLSKNGLFMEPLTYGFVSKDIKVLNMYAEVYRTEVSKDPIFIRYAIVDGYSNGIGDAALEKFKKLEGKANEPLLLKLPVDELTSGNYHVLLELFDKSKNTITTKKVDFVRSNPDFDKEFWKTYNKEDIYSFVSDFSQEELNYSLRAISAIVFEPKKSLMNFMIKEAPMKAQRKFLFDFWKEKYPSSPEISYYQFMEVAKALDLEYNSNVGYGFETDRGYMFLRYGKPNNVLSIDTEPDSFPYEIWYYNYLKETNQTNVRFIFYNKSLVHNDYELLHSTCVGERQNPRWEVELYRKGLEVPHASAIDATTVNDSWSRNARRYFNDY